MNPAPAAAPGTQQPQSPGVTGNTGASNIVRDANGGYILHVSKPRDPNSPSNKLLNNYSNNSIMKMVPSAANTADPEKKKARDLYISGSEKSLKGDQQGAIADYTESIKHSPVAITFLKRNRIVHISEEGFAVSKHRTSKVPQKIWRSISQRIKLRQWPIITLGDVNSWIRITNPPLRIMKWS